MKIRRFSQFINEDQNLDRPKDLVIVSDNNENCMILQDPETKKRWVFAYEHIDEKKFKYYGDKEYEIIGRDEDGDLEYYYDYDSYETTSDDRLAYVKDHLKKMSIGKGTEGWGDGDDLVELDTMLAHDLLDLYGHFTPKQLGLT